MTLQLSLYLPLCIAVSWLPNTQLLAQPALAPVNLIRNGGFEIGPDPGQYITLRSGSTAIEGWTITAGSVDLVGLFWNSSNGIRSLDLSGFAGDAGEVTQTFATTTGAKYRINFDLAGHPTCGSRVKRVRVSASNESMEFNFDVTGHTTSSMDWKTQSLLFIAVSQSTTIRFLSLEASGCGPALDNVIVLPEAIPTVLSASQIASGGGWKTSLTIVNLLPTQNSVNVTFRADDGRLLPLPLVITQQGVRQLVTASSVDRAAPPGATLLIESEAPASSATLVGWAEVISSGPVAGFAIFRQRGRDDRDAEGTAPLESGLVRSDLASNRLILPFDNTAGFVTGIALVNWSNQAVIITTTIRDDNGSQIDLQAVAVPPMGHTSFAVTDRFSTTGDRRGIIEFQNAAGGAITGIGLRFSPFASFTSIPIMVR